MTPVQTISTSQMRRMSQGSRHLWAILLVIECLGRVVHRKASFWPSNLVLLNRSHSLFCKKLVFKRTNSHADWTSLRKSSIYFMARTGKISKTSRSWKITGTLVFHTCATMSPYSSNFTTLRNLKPLSSIFKNTMSCSVSRIIFDYLDRRKF